MKEQDKKCKCCEAHFATMFPPCMVCKHGYIPQQEEESVAKEYEKYHPIHLGSDSKGCPICDPRQNEEWMEELDKIVPIFPGAGKLIKELISFIRSLLVEEREKVRVNIGQLRQWLNENRITDPEKMVTNEELKVFLGDKP